MELIDCHMNSLKGINVEVNYRFHVKDVLDLQWSSDGTSVASASVDNTVIIWDTIKGKHEMFVFPP